MSTIAELMAGKVPGSIKITYDSAHPDTWFQPFYCIGSKWYGINQSQQSDYYDGGTQWSVWKAPAETITVYEWLVTRSNYESGAHWVCPTLYTEEQAAAAFGSFRGHKKTGRSFRVPAP